MSINIYVLLFIAYKNPPLYNKIDIYTFIDILYLYNKVEIFHGVLLV